ncbi:MAG: MBL fold metallo-hydrolase [Ruminococcaceae bacterium]|nr:MBL fold metallo-hydrolase [Oscillospiraceae bacterium]
MGRTSKRIKQQQRKAKKIISIFIVLIALVLSLVAYLNPELFGQEPDDNPSTDAGLGEDAGEVRVHVIDVGQGDSILLTAPGGNVLFDAGDLASRHEQAIKNYLTDLGITTLDYFIITHPDADHIGGADMILTDFTVKNVIMPDITSNSQAFAAMLDALEKSQANVIEAVAGETYTLGDLNLKILAPLKKYSDTNDMSVVIRATYGQVSMMFTGDAEGNLEGKSEKDMLATYKASELDCDFLKVGHHGSDTSSSPAFVQAVSPKIAAISCGAGNKYGHPLQSVLDTLNAAGVVTYRTDLSGTLVFVCDGKTIEYKK